jgi:hypothetical protein
VDCIPNISITNDIGNGHTSVATLPGMKYNEYLYVIARIAFVLGLFGVGATIYVIWRGIPEPESAASGHGN